MFEVATTQENVPQTTFVKRRRLITTEMAKRRLETGEWQLRAMPGTSVRCRFFYEIFDGHTPLNTLSCKICGATYSIQSRSHYREHVRRRHSEIYCVRSSRSNNTSGIENSNMMSNGDESMNADSSYGLNYADGEADADELDDMDNSQLAPHYNLDDIDLNDIKTSFGVGGGADDDIVDEDNGMENSLCLDNDSQPLNAGSQSKSGRLQNSFVKQRRLVTTDTATVLSHLEIGDWQKRAIPGISIRSRFFVEIVEGDRPLNILLCKVCGSTYSAQSRSHCVEHVKKRHTSILEGLTDEPDFQYDLWRETRRPSPNSLQNMPVPYTLQNRSNGSSNAAAANRTTPTSDANKGTTNKSTPYILRPKVEPSSSNNATFNAQSPGMGFASRKRRRPVNPAVITNGPDQTIETPSIDDVLQSIASQVLNGSEDVDLDTLVKLQAPKRPTSFSNEIRVGNAKRFAAIGKLARDHSPSPAPLVGGINEQLIALSEMGLDYAQLRASEEAGEKSDAARVNNKSNEKSHEKARLQQNELNDMLSSSASSSPAPQLSAEGDFDEMASNNHNNSGNNSAMRSRPQLAMRGVNFSRPQTLLRRLPSSGNSGPKLNHQQLLMASRTAALLSGNADELAGDSSSAIRENGHTKTTLGKELYGIGDTNGFLSSQSNSNGASRSGGNFYGAYGARVNLHHAPNDIYNQFRMQQHHREMVANHHHQQQHMSSNRAGSGGIGGMLTLSGRSAYGGSAANSGSTGYDEQGGPFTVMHSRVTSGGYSDGASQQHDDSAFCKSCKSEFPNVLKGLNQLYNRVNDLIDVVQISLTHPSTHEALKANGAMLTRAIRRLDATARGGAAAVQRLTAGTSTSAIASARQPNNSDGVAKNGAASGNNAAMTSNTAVGKCEEDLEAAQCDEKAESDGSGSGGDNDIEEIHLDDNASAPPPPNLQRMDCEIAEQPDDDEDNGGEEDIDEDNDSDLQVLEDKNSDDDNAPTEELSHDGESAAVDEACDHNDNEEDNDGNVYNGQDSLEEDNENSSNKVASSEDESDDDGEQQQPKNIDDDNETLSN